MREKDTGTAGYILYEPRVRSLVTCVEASWTEPTVTCRPTGLQYLWINVGLGGETRPASRSNTAERAGTYVTCSGGYAAHRTWHDAWPSTEWTSFFAPYGGAGIIAGGDRMWAQVAYIHGSFRYTIGNLTTGWHATATTDAPHVTRIEADWLVSSGELPCEKKACSSAPLADFGTLRFSGANATIDGRLGSLGTTSWRRSRFDLYAPSLSAWTGSVTDHGRSFTITWKHR